jgi:hypothetical protein
MNKPIDGRTMLVVAAIRQSLQTNAGAGSSINMHPNPFFLQVNGEVDLLKAAELVIQKLGDHDQAQAEAAKATPAEHAKR